MVDILKWPVHERVAACLSWIGCCFKKSDSMPISALSSSTVRLLGSSAAIVTPCHLVKELLENAIDAGATSIEVNISANTVDRIQVRDNGHGIDFNDFDCLGRPDHTSKMTCFEDLQIKGVSTLGFRGQALASAACLAGICITTRTKQDPVASRLTLVPGLGGVQERKPISAPVGTTVNASKLFNALPVRKQQALKDSNKTLAKIKSLLQSYSLARCHVKLTFKVVGEARPRWAYSPSQFPTIEDAATQVFGISIASYYLHLSHEVTGSSERVTLQVLMPKPRCDLLSLKAVGVYINVNGRPIDSSRGLARKIAKLFRSCITKDRTIGSSVPFLHMSIVASPGSYDPNISAAKDEVLFPDEQQLLDDFEAMCNRVYTYSEASEDSIDALPLENLDTRNTSTPVVEKSQSGLPKLSSVTQADVPSPTVSRMRTAMRVDLSRKISDATDDATIVDMVDIQVPPREDPKRRDEKCAEAPWISTYSRTNQIRALKKRK
ncbi:histidine kinase-like ATPase [Stachybotrys elegans]|uniref:Histidine kinase-like ATPase n=1 Tax=Stachybotrys elegans TaxID=80388 RepID=A0A8K0T515_9HYPO|nr:histidine kinase-like ATPase [Stachybotrys elegans]